jgi:atypical dual specificity phosphatase
MWAWTLNWGRVRDDLVVGSCPMTVADIDAIREGTGATALLSVQHDECRAAFGIDLDAMRGHAARRGVALANAPMRDFDLADQRDRLAAAVRALATLLRDEHRVYVHCTAGINRAPLTVLGYLTFVESLCPREAYDLLRAGRPEADPYWDAWRGCRDDLLARHRDTIAARAYALSQAEPHAAPEQNWYRAEAEVLRGSLLARDEE